MDKKIYSISDLESVTGISRRTIHFYSKEGLIPPPTGTGGGARYGEIHKIRLLLIKELQKSHLKLSGIREALNALSFQEMQSLLQAAQQSDNKDQAEWSRDDLEQWLSGGQSMATGTSLEENEKSGGLKKMNFSFLSMGSSSSDASKEKEIKDTSFLSSLKRMPDVPMQKWSRYEISEGIELHIRGDVAAKIAEKINRIIQIIQGLFRK